jgi:putative cell wall binding repeat-containing protein
MNERGALAQNQWLKYQGKWYYLRKSGAIVHNQTVDVYFISSDGVWRKNETAKVAKVSGRIIERRRTYGEDFSPDFDDEEVFSENNGDWE